MLADKNILHFKHEILYQVARLAFEGNLEEGRDALPYELVKGPKPQFYCCIYKEREIIRQRIRLAEGKAPGAYDDGNIIQVITAASVSYTHLDVYKRQESLYAAVCRSCYLINPDIS